MRTVKQCMHVAKLHSFPSEAPFPESWEIANWHKRAIGHLTFKVKVFKQVTIFKYSFAVMD